MARFNRKKLKARARTQKTKKMSKSLVVSRFKGMKRSRPMRYVSAAGSITNSLWSFGRRRASKQVLAMRRVGAPDVQLRNYAQQIQVAQNTQRFVSFEGCSPAQLLSLLTTAGNQNSPNRALVESSMNELTFTNPTNGPLELEIYDIVFKRDVPNGFNLTLSSGTYSIVGSVEGMIAGGILAGGQYGPTSTAKPDQIIGASPYDSQLFKDYCKVSKRSHVLLSSGASHRHQVINKVNRVIDQSIASGDLTYIKGWSYAVLINVRGIAGYDDTPLSALSGVNKTTLDVVTTSRIKYTYVQDVSNTLYYTNSLTGETEVQVRNIGNGAIEYIDT